MKEDDEVVILRVVEIWIYSKKLKKIFATGKKKEKVMINKKRQISFHERAILGT